MPLASGTRLGPYEVLGLLGAGGMGEVYRARDPRLDRLVAVKVLLPGTATDPDRLARFEREAKAVAALNHPHILTVHDVGVHEGTPYVVTELLEGATLREVVASTPRQVLGWAVQAARGLAAAHHKGLVHRDLKPENLFLTLDGRVKILDFGLATQRHAPALDDQTVPSPTVPGVVMGTVAYMSPEQVQGRVVDARSDLFSFGVVLYELLTSKHPYRRATAGETLAAILHETPAPLTSTIPSLPRALDGIVRRCLEKKPEDRFQGAHDLGLALEAVLAAPAGSPVLDEVEERSPYPGLASFAEKDAAHFFGREAEVTALWMRIRTRPLLAVIGPSGTGKTSFIRAGIIPAAPDGWRCLWVTPGNRPFAAVARALVPELSNDPETLQRLVGAESADHLLTALGVWRRRHGEALLVVDQFEELFTLNAKEVQERFAAFLGQLASAADVHVVLSLRDDFLMRSQEHPPLRPILTDLTALLPLSADALRLAVVEPAKTRGYRFEDETLVREMVESVEGARAALPLLAFAVSRLWEARDKDSKVLTRAAYEEIGGVAGALAQHAEAVMDRVGAGHDVVREIFRNLVTAQGTRAVVDRDELLSAFPERTAAEQVLRELIDARLVTSYEVEGREGEASHHRVEVVHESLLKAWPRLVLWQTQDEEGAQLRDQLKQAAHLWDEKNRTEDLLWTGTAYQEFELWRGRYPGALTALEEDFARSMARKAQRRKRLLAATVAAVIVALAATAIAIGISRQQAMRARDQARAETSQREAAQLVSLGRLRLADSPNAALAYAIASLEQTDNDPARRFALEALWQGPSALYFPGDSGVVRLIWSPDGRSIAGSWQNLRLFNGDTGESRQLSPRAERPVGFTSDGGRLVTSQRTPDGGMVFRVWVLQDGKIDRTLGPDERATAVFVNDRLLTFTQPSLDGPRVVRRLSLDGATQEDLGRWEPHDLRDWDLDPNATSLFSMQGNSVLEQRLDALAKPGRVLGAHGGTGLWARPWRDRVVTSDAAGEVRIWDVPAARLVRTLKSPADASWLALDPKERWLATSPFGAATPRSVFLFDLLAARTAEPAPLLEAWTWMNAMEFSPDGSWLAVLDDGALTFWNLAGPRSTVLGRQKAPYVAVAFTPDGHLLSSSDEGVLRRWPLSPAGGEDVREYRPGAVIGMSIDLDRQGRFAVLPDRLAGKVLVVPLDGAAPVSHPLKDGSGAYNARVDPSGRFVAVLAGAGDRTNLIRILDLNTRAERTLDTRAERNGCLDPAVGSATTPVWLPDGRLVTDGPTGLNVWDLATGASELLRPCWRGSTSWIHLLATPDSRAVLRLDGVLKIGQASSLVAFDLASRKTREISAHGNTLKSFALDATGTVLVTGDVSGIVRVGPLTGEEPHLLFGHTAQVTSVAVSPDGRWIASGSDDGTIRLWPMPDLSKPPLHTLPHGELLTKLRALTNLRAVRDPASDTGWKIDVGPFPGWAVVPTWQP